MSNATLILEAAISAAAEADSDEEVQDIMLAASQMARGEGVPRGRIRHSAKAFKIPDEAIFVRHFPDLRQQTSWTCGASALEAVARYNNVGGDGQGEDGGASEEWFAKQLGTTAEEGTPPQRMVELAKTLGLKVVHVGAMTEAELKKTVRGGVPVIVLVQAWVDDDAQKDGWDDGHYVVVIGHDKDHVYFEDPSLERTRGWMMWADFLRRWHDVGGDGTKYVHWGLALTKAEEPAEEIKASAVRRKCQSGPNAGKPGVCPKPGSGGGSATTADSHEHPARAFELAAPKAHEAAAKLSDSAVRRLAAQAGTAVVEGAKAAHAEIAKVASDPVQQHVLLAAVIGTADHWMTNQFISDMAASPVSPMTAIKAVASVSAWAMASGIRYLVDGLEGMPGMKGVSVTPEEIRAAAAASRRMIESLGKKAPDDAALKAMVLESLKGASTGRGAAIAKRLEKPPTPDEWYARVGLRGRQGKAGQSVRKMLWETKCDHGVNQGKPGPCPEDVAKPTGQNPDAGAQKPSLFGRISSLFGGGKTKPDQKPAGESSSKKPAAKIDVNAKPPAGIGEHGTAAIAKLTPEQKQAVVHYTTGGYEAINNAMMKCPPKFECVSGEEKKNMDAMEAAIAASPPFKEPVDVFRGLNLTGEKRKQLIAKMAAAAESGETITMPCITSTSTDPKYVLNYFSGGAAAADDGVIFQIKAKTGLPVASVSYHPEESEITKSSKTRYKVVDSATRTFTGGKREVSKHVIYLEEVDETTTKSLRSIIVKSSKDETLGKTLLKEKPAATKPKSDKFVGGDEEADALMMLLGVSEEKEEKRKES